MKHKLLIASGCSYTANNGNWPGPLSNLLNYTLVNYGKPAVGNGRISRSIIYSIPEALKAYDAKDILVGIVWSGSNRQEIYQSEIDLDNITKSHYNPHGFIPNKKNWVTINHHFKDEYSQLFYRNFHDQIWSEILTLEHVLRTQWFLEKHNINYFMSTFAPGVLPESVDESTDHLLKLIDFSKFLKVKSVMEWCIEESGLPISKDDERYMAAGVINNMHPTPEHSKKFAEEIILPFIREKYGIQQN